MHDQIAGISSARPQDNGADALVSQNSRRPRWRAPVLKRLDVDLTATNVRTSNESPTKQTQFKS